MTEVSYPFAVPPGNTMSENQWAQMFRYLLGTGVITVSFQDQLNQLIVTPSSQVLSVDIDTGAAFIQGHYYQNDSVNTVTLDAPDGSDIRADLIVLECKWGLNAGITAKNVSGTPGAVYPSTDPRSGNPMPATLVQTYGVRWQTALCQVNVRPAATTFAATDLIDLRNFVGNGGAQANAIIVAMPNASDKMRENADFQIPSTTNYPAEEVINTALDALPACGGTVMLSEGDCVLGDSITLPVNSTLAGCGTQTTLTLSPLATAGPMINIPAANCVVHDMLLNGGGVGAGVFTALPLTGFDGIYVSAGYATIFNVSINNAKNFGVNVAQGTGSLKRVNVRGCYISYAYGDAIAYSGSTGQVLDNTIEFCGDNGIHITCASGAATNANKFEGNIITSCGLNGIYIDGTTSTKGLMFNMVSNNEIGNCGQTGPTPSSCCILLSGGGCYATSLISNYGWSAGPSLYTKYGIGISSSAVFDTRGVGNDMIDASYGTGAYDIILNGATFHTLGLNLYDTNHA